MTGGVGADDAAMGGEAISRDDVKRFRDGSHSRLYQQLGCQLDANGGRFTVWAPRAAAVSVIGDFNGWSGDALPLARRDGDSGLWALYVRGLAEGACYKYRIVHRDGTAGDKADPFAFAGEPAPGSASRAHRSHYAWGDGEWMARRRAGEASALARAPISIYELHPGSWRWASDRGLPNYRDLAAPLSAYVSESGFSHVEFMPFLPLRRQSLDGQAGYCDNGYFAPCALYGSPEDFMFLVDTLHRAGIGVFLDWPAARFVDEAHGLQEFDGERLYEADDAMASNEPGPGARLFDYARPEVCAFLVSSALFWLDRFHIDGLRIASLARMLYLDYARGAGQWRPNRQGGKENLEAIDFLRRVNESVRNAYPDVCMIAEDSSGWPMTSRPAQLGGLGFSMVWNSAWMRATMAYFRHDPLFRKFHHDELVALAERAFAENFVLPLAHDALVNAQASLLMQMPGDLWQRFAGLRCLYGYMWALPGKKLLFMGGEFGQCAPWGDGELDWPALAAPEHGGVRRWIGDLNRLYREEPALHELDFDAAGFAWIDASDRESSVLSFVRRSPAGRVVLVVCNFTPVLRTNYVVGAPVTGRWCEALNSDAAIYGGSGAGNFGLIDAMPVPAHGQLNSLAVTLPPHGVLLLVPEDNDGQSRPAF